MKIFSRYLPILLVLSVATASEPSRQGVQDLRIQAPNGVSRGRVVLQGHVVHRAVDGSWIKFNVQSEWGAVTYLISQIDSALGVLPLVPGTPEPPVGAQVSRSSDWKQIRATGTTPLWLEGDIIDVRHDGTDLEGRVAFRDQIVRLQFKLVENRPRGFEPAPTYRNISYGPHARQTLDVYLAKASRPTPVAVYIHGGAWVAGDKSGITQYRGFLDAGISVVALNYRYCPPENPEVGTPPVAVPLYDAARAIQFIRSMATDWGLAADRLGIWGASAGACTALWLATHPDLADPSATDPVARQSTRPSCVAALLAQTSLDPQEMRAWVGPGITYGAHAFGISSGRGAADFERFLAARDHIQPWIAAYSPAALLAHESAPVFLDYLDFSLTPCEPLGSYYTHSPRFGLGFYERAQQVRHECYLRFEGREDTAYASWQRFMLARLAQ